MEMEMEIETETEIMCVSGGERERVSASVRKHTCTHVRASERE